MVTPIGICLSFYEQSNNFIFVYFNDQRIKLYDNNKLAVVDAAMQAEFANSGLFPKRGKELNYFVNGKPRITRGSLGEAAVIMVNGQEADIYTPIHANDQIKVVESTAGEPAALDIDKLPEYGAALWVEVNEKKVELPVFAMVNGHLQSGFYGIKENDSIEFLNYYTVRQIAEFMDVIINQDMNIYVNNKLADMDTKVYENFSVIWTMEELQLSDRDIYGSGAPDTYANLPEDDGSYVKSEPRKEEKNLFTEENSMLNAGTGMESEGEGAQEANTDPVKTDANAIKTNADTVTDVSGANESKSEGTDNKTENSKYNIPRSIQVTVNGEQIRLEGKTEYIFVDVFDYIDFDLSVPQGSGIATKLNEKDAQYMEPIHSGDVIKIYWKD